MAFLKHVVTRKSYTPRISLSSNGFLGLSDAAVRKYRLQDYKYIVMYYDPDRNVAAIEPINDENAEGAMKLRHRDQGANVSARSFLENFEIVIPATTSYALDKDRETGYLIFDLGKGRIRNSSQKLDGSDDSDDEE